MHPSPLQWILSSQCQCTTCCDPCAAPRQQHLAAAASAACLAAQQLQAPPRAPCPHLAPARVPRTVFKPPMFCHSASRSPRLCQGVICPLTVRQREDSCQFETEHGAFSMPHLPLRCQLPCRAIIGSRGGAPPPRMSPFRWLGWRPDEGEVPPSAAACAASHPGRRRRPCAARTSVKPLAGALHASIASDG